MSAPPESQILALVDAAAAADGVGPLSEHALLALRNGAPGRTVVEDGVVVGYAHLDPATEEESAAAELVVHPEHRRRGHGRALLRGLLQDAAPLRVWAHGDLPAAAALAASEGMERVRVLFQMRRPAAEPLPAPDIADGVTLRTFVPGQDEEEWLKVNAAAFAHHPEQGAWTLDDVRAREREGWFDPAGFFLAERDGRIAGFHWTKVHPDGLGEVYVVGVDPSAQGLGLGRALTLAGLHHLRDRGVPQILLYVDESNAAAVRLYRSLGFSPHTVDVMYGS
ncbi:mycothiol synthase [Actinomadura macrotermitis]|uniref:Mycothiol acetyltransferase n=1 Tax=Actinomadura macrotermitis TaxID=2585200 RepID=A0A7K0BUZ0_9ACTN|nr:mycothiol synthase [Actinomadura macrotermitis]MQY04484.1 Mycothiol acetyltransferase [Actinomadura macrotermitis]